MSKVYSFRLEENNPREAQAREVIEAWVSKGYSLRQIIVDALNRYDGNENQNGDLNLLLKQLRELIDQDARRTTSIGRENETAVALSSSFLEGIRRSKKTGIEAE